MRQQAVTANGIDFAYLESGPADGPLALCLHGFPDTAHTWRHLLPVLGDAGYHAVAPWMRGYSPTSLAPDGAYQVGALAADAGALHDALGGDADAVVIGHDWGAFAAYGAAGVEPARWRRVVTMAVPPLAASASTFFTYAQLKRSFYIFLFQLPLAEAAVSGDDFAFIAGLWSDWSPGYEVTWDVARVKESIGAPDNLSAAIGYYRAMFDAGLHRPEYAEGQAAASGVPSQPTLYLHGDRDGALGVEAARHAGAVLAPGSVHHVIEGAGHFLHLEEPDAVGALVLDFLAG